MKKCKNTKETPHTCCAEWHGLLGERCRIQWVMGRQCEQNAESERQRWGDAVSFFSVLLILQTESWVTARTHTHAPKASFAGIPTADIRCCKLPISSLLFLLSSLWFLAGYRCSSLACGFPVSFCLCFGLRWEKLRPHPALLPFLSLSLQHESIHPSAYYCAVIIRIWMHIIKGN